jgi:WD40 repeat protein
LPASHVDRVPRSIVLRTALALVMAGLSGCAPAVPQKSVQPSRDELAAPRRAFHAGDENLLDVRFHPDGRRVATIGHSAKVSRIRIWDIATGDQVRVIEPTVATLLGRIAFSPDGMTLAAGDTNGSVRVWDDETRRERLVLPGHSGTVFHVAFSPDGATLASASDDTTIRLWDARTGRHVHTLQGHSRQVTRLAFSPVGKTLASASSNFGDNVRIWEVATGECLRVLKGHQTQAHAVAFHPDGRQLASASKDGIRLWDPTTGAEQLFIPIPGDAWSLALVYTPDGSRLISSGDGGVVRIWEPATGKIVQAFRADPDRIGGLAVSPDGRTIATVGGDGALKLWDSPIREPDKLSSERGEVPQN